MFAAFPHILLYFSYIRIANALSSTRKEDATQARPAARATVLTLPTIYFQLCFLQLVNRALVVSAFQRFNTTVNMFSNALC
jgi:hypothetical protein